MNYEDFKDMLSQMIVMGGALGIGLGIMFAVMAIVCKLLSIPFS
jgi:hypothetical protein